MLMDAIQEKIDKKTKPLGSLGYLEEIALKVARIQNTLNPVLSQPHIVVFAADHGLVAEGISAYPPEVTRQMVLNFLEGGAAINVFCTQHDISLKIVDAGVNATFSRHKDLLVSKCKNGTENILKCPAMSKAQVDFSLESGSRIVKEIAEKGCNIIGFGEMGIGNTSSASLLISALLNLPIEACVGRGTGVSDEQLAHKLAVLGQVIQFQNLKNNEALEVLQKVGGFEIAQMCGAFIEAKNQGMVILIDGFIATAALLVASKINAAVIDNCLFCHQSDEQAHQKVLEHFNTKVILQLGLRLGEGTGCALAYPLVQSAVDFMNEMASFDKAQVSKKHV